jgi:hypothetical protein
MPRAEAESAIRGNLGVKGEPIADSLAEAPLWSTLTSCAWRAAFEGRDVLVQITRPAVPVREFARFKDSVRGLQEPGVAAALTQETLAEFETWLRLGEAPGRERSYLETLEEFPQTTFVEYPRLVAEACSGSILCQEWVEGEPLSALFEQGANNLHAKLAEAVLEQACVVSVVDADMDLDTLVLKPDGRLAMRRAERLVSIPAAMARPLLKYITAVLAGNSQVANHQLIRMASGRSSTRMESELFDALSNLEPELKINLRFPPSASGFESNWRGLARVQRERPHFVDALHRNLIAAGYLAAEAAETGAEDPIADAQWPVVGRLLSRRLGDVASAGIGQQWLMGSGLLLLESMRQATRMAEGFRENDLSFSFSPSISEDASRQANRAIRTGVILVILLTIFLACLRWGPKAPAPWSGLIVAAAAVSGLVMLWLLFRIR